MNVNRLQRRAKLFLPPLKIHMLSDRQQKSLIPVLDYVLALTGCERMRVWHDGYNSMEVRCDLHPRPREENLVSPLLLSYYQKRIHFANLTSQSWKRRFSEKCVHRVPSVSASSLCFPWRSHSIAYKTLYLEYLWGVGKGVHIYRVILWTPICNGAAAHFVGQEAEEKGHLVRKP